MSQRNTNEYEALYNVGMLDDIHNYFPDLLYNSDRFSSVQDVLRYIQQSTRNRFDLYSFGLRDFNERYNIRPVTTAPAAPTMRPRNQAQRGAPIRPPPVSAPATPPSVHQPPPPSISMNLTTEDDPELAAHLDELVNFMSTQPRYPNRVGAGAFSFLSNLLGPPPATFPLLRRRDADPMNQAFMEPVVVRPTEEQVQAGSRIDFVGAVTDTQCAICQAGFEIGEERRTLSACNHEFHRTCIDPWFEQNVHCPVCRHDIRSNEVN